MIPRWRKFGSRSRASGDESTDDAARSESLYHWGFHVGDSEVMSILERVPRAEFLPSYQRNYAYENRALPIAHGQTNSQPYIVALMTSHLALGSGKKVLEVGTGSGYQTAMLAELTDQVFTIEVIPTLSEGAQETLTRLNYEGIRFRIGDGSQGWPEEAPFDAIIVTCAAPVVPPALWEQLRAPGGRLVIPVGETPHGQELLLFVKQHENDDPGAGELLCPVRFVPLTH